MVIKDLIPDGARKAYNSVSGRVGEMFDKLRGQSADAPDKVLGGQGAAPEAAMNTSAEQPKPSARTASVQPPGSTAADRANARIEAERMNAARAAGSAPAQPAPASASTAVKTWNPVEGQRFGPGGQPPAGGAAVVRDPSLPPQGNVYEGQRVPPQDAGANTIRGNPNVRPGVPSPEAAEFARQGGGAAVQPTRPGLLSRAGAMLGKLGTGAAAASGAYTGVTEGAGAVTGNGTSTEDLRKEMGLPAGETALFRGARSMGMPENAARLVDDVGSRFAGMANRVAGGVIGALPDASSSTAIRFSTEGGVRAPEKEVPKQGPAMPPAEKPYTPLEGHLKMEPIEARGQLRGAPLVLGVGDEPQSTDSRGARGQDAQPAQRGLGGWAGAMLNYKNAQYQESNKRANAETSIKQSQAQSAAARVALDARKANSETVAARIKNAVEANPELLKMDKETAARTSAQQTAQMTKRAEYSLGRRNAGKGDVSPEGVNRFLDAEKWRAAVESSRGQFLQQWRDRFGDKQFDSEDSFSYIPAYRDKSGRIYTENGNNIGDTQSYRQSNWFDPNKIDADMQRHVRNLPTKEEFEAARKKKEQ